MSRFEAPRIASVSDVNEQFVIGNPNQTFAAPHGCLDQRRIFRDIARRIT